MEYDQEKIQKLDEGIRENNYKLVDKLIDDNIMIKINTLNYLFIGENSNQQKKRIEMVNFIFKKKHISIDPTITKKSILQFNHYNRKFMAFIIKCHPNLILTIDDLEKISFYPNSDMEYFYIWCDTGKLDNSAFLYLLKIFELEDDIMLEIYKKHNLNSDHKNLLVSIARKKTKCVKYLVFEKNIKFDDVCFECYVDHYHGEFDDELLFKDINFSQIHLEKALLAKNHHICEYLVNKKNIQFNEKCYNYYFDSNYHLIFGINNNEPNYEILFANFVPNIEHLYLALTKKNIDIACYLVKHKNLKFDDKCFELYTKHIDNVLHANIYDILFNNFHLQSHHLSSAILNKRLNLIEYLMVEKNITCDDMCVTNYYIGGLYKMCNKHIYNLIFENTIFTSKHLELACQFRDDITAINILNQKSFILNFDAYMDVLLKKNINTDVFVYPNDSSVAPNICASVSKIILAMCQFGFVMDEKYIILAINNNFILDEKITQNFIPSENFYEYCFFPKRIPTACKDIYWARKMCKNYNTNKDLAELKKFVKKYNIELDYICFKNCNFNIKVMDLLSDFSNEKNALQIKKPPQIKKPKQKTTKKKTTKSDSDTDYN